MKQEVFTIDFGTHEKRTQAVTKSTLDKKHHQILSPSIKRLIMSTFVIGLAIVHIVFGLADLLRMKNEKANDSLKLKERSSDWTDRYDGICYISILLNIQSMLFALILTFSTKSLEELWEKRGIPLNVLHLILVFCLHAFVAARIELRTYYFSTVLPISLAFLLMTTGFLYYIFHTETLSQEEKKRIKKNIVVWKKAKNDVKEVIRMYTAFAYPQENEPGC